MIPSSSVLVGAGRCRLVLHVVHRKPPLWRRSSMHRRNPVDVVYESEPTSKQVSRREALRRLKRKRTSPGVIASGRGRARDV